MTAFQLGSDVDANSHSILNLSAPANATDAATKAYVDVLTDVESIDLSAQVLPDQYSITKRYSIITAVDTSIGSGSVLLPDPTPGLTMTVINAAGAGTFGVVYVNAGIAMDGNTTPGANLVLTPSGKAVTFYGVSTTGWISNPFSFPSTGVDLAGTTLFDSTDAHGFSISSGAVTLGQAILSGDQASDQIVHLVSGLKIGSGSGGIGSDDSAPVDFPNGVNIQGSTGGGLGLSAGATCDMGGGIVGDVRDPIDPQDAATKNYVDSGALHTFTAAIPAGTTVDIAAGTFLDPNDGDYAWDGIIYVKDTVSGSLLVEDGNLIVATDPVAFGGRAAIWSPGTTVVGSAVLVFNAVLSSGAIQLNVQNTVANDYTATLRLYKQHKFS